MNRRPASSTRSFRCPPAASGVLALATLVLPAVAVRGDEAALDLALGDPARKDKEAALVLDAITDSRTGATLTPAELAQRLAKVRVLFLGESHTNAEFHRVQLQVIRELARSGRKVLLGLEMYPANEQAPLDQWNAGKLSEDAFVAGSRWYKSWGYNWGYYREIFLLAKEKGIPIHAVNAPRETIANVRKKGFDGLTPEEKAQLPPKVDTTNEEHRTLFKAFFGGDDALHTTSMPAEMWEGLYRAQCAWDAVMAYNAVQALKKDGTPDAIMVVLIGAGHVAYGLGAERQAAQWFDGKMASVIPIPVLDEKDRKPKVRASYADFVWGVPKETEPVYPVTGISTRETKGVEGLPVIQVEKDGVGAAAGVTVGDVLLSVDGTPAKDKEAVNRVMADKRWSDSAELKVKRGEKEIVLKALFKRKVEEKPAPAKP